ncbi:MAG: InlB B-repeat-containing protein, partial [Muribaculaceae bacterium]|nr:InlB B-repeat-containing protein [Muribaculaceae bacterium]
MRTKLITLIVVMVAFVTAIIAQQYERVIKIYKDGTVLNSYVVSEIDSIKFDKVALYEVGVESSPATGGMATINGVHEAQLLKEGDMVTLTAVAEAGYTFAGWSTDNFIISAENPYVTVVEGAATYVANFEQRLNYCYPTGNMQHSVRYLSNFTLTDGVSEVLVDEIQLSSKDEVYKDRTSSVLVSEAGSTLYFSKLNWNGEWMHGYVYIDYNSDGVFNTTSNALALNNGELVSYNFLAEKGASAGTNSKGEVVSNGCDVLASNMPSWVLPSTLMPGDYRLRFKIDWNDSDPCGSVRENNEIQKNGGCICDITLRIVTAGAGPVATSKVTPEGAGTVQITDENKRDGKVVLFATANQGYVFESWKVMGEEISNANPYEAEITTDTEYEALFRTAQMVSVIATSTEGGTAEVSESNAMEGTTVLLTATPADGYKFLNWTLNGEIVSTENPYTAVVNGNSEYVANFADKYAQITNVPTIYINTENGVGVTSKEDYVTAYVTVRGAENEADNITEVLTEIKG